MKLEGAERSMGTEGEGGFTGINGENDGKIGYSTKSKGTERSMGPEGRKGRREERKA
jgi:hypothetical protein